MAKVISFGDSFTWGSDLADCITIDEFHCKPQAWQDLHGFYSTYSRSTWPALLAQHYGIDYQCLAEPGCSNQSIVRKFFESINTFAPTDIINVNFTWQDRYDIYDEIAGEWVTLRPSGTEDSKYYEMYYKHIQNNVWDQVESLKAINLVVSYLKEHNYAHIITCIDSHTYKYGVSKVTNNLKSVYEDSIRWFDGEGFYQWSKHNNFKISDAWHPLEDAHRAAFELIANE